MSTNIEHDMAKSSNLHSTAFIKMATNLKSQYSKNTAFPLML